ncbi:MAG: penicillin-binding protein 2 [Myxococcota bacterium]|nr:penicillin-binding protein 2 [Myxococcota bacterium]
MVHLVTSLNHGEGQQKLYRLTMILSLFMIIATVRLAWLQFVRGDHYERLALKNVLRQRPIGTERGRIFDRNGTLLVTNRPSFDLYLNGKEIEARRPLLKAMSALFGFDPLTELRLEESLDEKSRNAILAVRDITRDELAQVKSLGSLYGGVEVRASSQRHYPEGEIGAHLLGYLGRPNRRELQERSELNTRSMVGRFGVERREELRLQGRAGRERYIVDARGRRSNAPWAQPLIARHAEHLPPQPGADLTLTVDAKLQRILYRALDGYVSGAIVVTDPRNGDVLGMVSKPSFDPNLWSGRLSAEAKRAIDENPYEPLLDKSVQSYFPGSVYKVVTAFAAIEEEILDPGQPISSPGRYLYGNHVFHCHKLSGHGRVDLNGAMAASADVYFYKLGERLGIDRLATYARRLGFGSKSGLNLNSESGGLVPTRAFHEENSREGFQYGLALSSAIGQGDVRSSPLQVSMAFAALANHGTLYKPRLIQRYQLSNVAAAEVQRPEIHSRVEAAPSTISAIRRSLERAVHDPQRATGYRAAVSMGHIAGKTGTAQVRKIDRARRRSPDRFRDRDHAWFAAFAPYESPRLSIAIFLEHGGSGGKNAAPIARRIIEAYHQEIDAIFDTQASAQRFPQAIRRR